MEEKLAIPKFSDEAEEAKWWFDHQDELFGEFEQAGKEGRLGRGTVARLATAASAAIVLDPEDVARAQKQAEGKGLEYLVYVKKVVHEALLHEEQRAYGLISKSISTSRPNMQIVASPK